MTSTITAPCLVLHVRTGYEAREAHMRDMLARLGIQYRFFTDGDICDMDDDLRRRIFTGHMLEVSPALQSCTCKHLLAYRYILDNDLQGALILEDDISLTPAFPDIFNRALGEYTARCDPGRPAIISFEATRLRFVPYSQRRKGRVLYPGPHDRLAGAYYINAPACRLICAFAQRHKIHLPVDNLHTYLIHSPSDTLDYYWTEPAPAMQGSFNGQFQSSLSVRHPGLNILRPRLLHIIWRVKYLYRRLLYRLR